MQHNFIQKVGNEVYHATYEVEGNKLVVTCDGQRREEELDYRTHDYQSRDLLREIVREKAKQSIAA